MPIPVKFPASIGVPCSRGRMNQNNSVGWILLVLFHCVLWTAAETVVEVANSHLLPPGGYRRLINREAEEYPRDCSEIFKQSEENASDGLYIIQPAKEPIGVHCNMQEGGWTVIQHITANSTVDFDRTWQDYKYGFGLVNDNYWLGNEYMHQLTSSPTLYKLRVKLVDLNAQIKWGEYEPFHIEDETSQYRIRLGLYKGNAGDALCQDTEAYLHDNQRFTTKDRDNDNYFQNCAKLEFNGIPGGGWWYDACAGANLNRRNVIYWQQDCNKTHMCKYAWMMVRPVDHSRDCSEVCPFQKEEL